MRSPRPRIGARLIRLRKAAGLTQEQLHRKARLPVPTISRYENNHSTPGGAIIKRLCRALKCTADDILGGTGA